MEGRNGRLSASNSESRDSEHSLHLQKDIAVLDQPESSKEDGDDPVTRLSDAANQSCLQEEKIEPKETLADLGVLVCVFLGNVVCAVDMTGIGVFFPYLMEHFEANAFKVSWVSSIYGLAQAIASLFASYPIQLYGCRSPGVIGSLLSFIGISLSSVAPSLLVTYVTYGIIAGYGAGLFWLSATVVVHQRFSRNRNLASGIASVGLGIGGIVGPFITSFAIQLYGWRGAFLVLGMVHAQRIPLCLFFRTPAKYAPKSIGEEGNRRSLDCSAIGKYLKETFDFSLLRHAGFALYASAYTLHVFALYAFMIHTVNRALNVGLNQEQAVTASSLTFIVSTLSRVVVSFIVNIPSVSPSIVFGIGMYVASVSIIVIYVLPEITATMTSVVLFGIHQGCTITCYSTVVVFIMGVKLLPRCQAILMCFGGVTKLLGPACIGWIYDMTKNYNDAFAIIGCFAFLAGSLMTLSIVAGRRKRSSTSKSPTSVC